VSALDWSRRRREVDTASERLGKLPVSETRHGAAVPFPYRDRGAYKAGHTNKEINRRIQTAPVERVPLRGLHAIQHSVKPRRVEQYIRDPELRGHGDKHPGAGTPTDYPIVIQQDGVRYIHDGHHRLTAKELEGKGYARVRLVHL
jgi:hypothetical protein